MLFFLNDIKRNKGILLMSEKKKVNYFENYESSESPNIYKYSRSKYTDTKSAPSLNSVYHDALIYRKEIYGVFVKFDNKNFNALLHKSKLGGKSLDNFNIDDIISVTVIEIKNNKKISVRLFQEDFPSLGACKVNLSNRWGDNLTKVMERVPSEKMRKMNGMVKCKYSGKFISEKMAFKCKESINGELYYFESLNLVLKYNKEKNRYLKLLLDDGKLEKIDYVSIHKNENIDDIDVL